MGEKSIHASVSAWQTKVTSASEFQREWLAQASLMDTMLGVEAGEGLEGPWEPVGEAARVAAALELRPDKKRKIWTWNDASVNCKGDVIKNGISMIQQNNNITYDGQGFGRGICTQGPQGPPEENPGSVETIVALTQPQWGAYFHFVIDSLPRIAYIHQQMPEVIKSPTTFYHTGMSNKLAQDWANLVGIKTSEGEGNRLLQGHWKAKTVIFPPSNGRAQVRGADPNSIQWCRDQIGSRVTSQSALYPPAVAMPMLALAPRARSTEAPAGGRAGTALFIRRHPFYQARGVLNHEELVEALQDELKGWKIEVHADYPNPPDIPTTCRMFQRADMIIGPHGAGFANMLCAREGVPLVEMRQKRHSHDFEFLAIKLGMPYFGMPTNMEHGSRHNLSAVDLRTVVRAALPAAVNRQKTHSTTRLESTVYCGKNPKYGCE